MQYTELESMFGTTEFYLRLCQLTLTEKSVLFMRLKGYTNTQVSTQLKLTKLTLKAYLHSIYNKFEVNNGITDIMSMYISYLEGGGCME